MNDAPPSHTAARVISRWQAAGLHLLISAVIAAAALFLMLGVWYPPPLFAAEGGTGLLVVLIAVDVVLGPLITLIIFRVGKPRLRTDLTCIAVLQLCALVYGVHVMFQARPVFVVLIEDQFETVRANDLDAQALAQARVPEYRALPLTGPVYVAVEIPKDKKELHDLIASASKGGAVITQLPKYYVPYAQQQKKAAAKGRPLADAVKDGGALAAHIQKYLAPTGRNAADLKFMPMQTRRGWGLVLIDAGTGEIVALAPPMG